MRTIIFLGDSRRAIRDFPASARNRAGLELRAIQAGCEPYDWKPMNSIGSGVREIRIRDENGAFRVIYLAKLAEGILVLHAFQKKSAKTAKRDIALAAERLRSWKEAR